MLQGQGLTEKGNEGNLWGFGNVLYLDKGLGYMGACTDT